MTRDEIDLQQSDDMDLLVEVSDETLKATCSGLIQGPPKEHAAPYRGEFRQRRSVYNGKGEYEFQTARHYVPQYWAPAGATVTRATNPCQNTNARRWPFFYATREQCEFVNYHGFCVANPYALPQTYSPRQRRG